MTQDLREKAKRMLAQLGGDLKRIDYQDKAMTAAAEKIVAHHANQAELMNRSIAAPRGSALEAAVLSHIREAATARRVAQSSPRAAQEDRTI